MTQEEGNKLIMFFDGAENLEIEVSGKATPAIKYKESFYPEWNLPRFNSDWNLLMPVVDDIKYGRRFSCVVWNEISHPSYRLYKAIEKGLLNLSLSQTHEAVVKFIQWYNTTKK